MFKYRLSNMLATIVLAMMMALTACAPQRVESMPIATLTQDKPIALRLAVADGEGYPSEKYVLEFVDQVNMLSNGNITIEPVWSAGDSTDAGFETGVIQLVKKGEVELGLAGSRAFDTESITSFQALQTAVSHRQ